MPDYNPNIQVNNGQLIVTGRVVHIKPVHEKDRSPTNLFELTVSGNGKICSSRYQ